MRYRNDLGIWGNLQRLFTERNRQQTEIETNKTEINAKVDANQIETDEIILDQEERLILLEIGE